MNAFLQTHLKAFNSPRKVYSPLKTIINAKKSLQQLVFVDK